MKLRFVVLVTGLVLWFIFYGIGDFYPAHADKGGRKILGKEIRECI